MDTLWEILAHPFTWGLMLGLLVAAFLMKNAISARSAAKREITRLNGEIDQLQKHINTHLKITAAGADRLESDLASLRQQNETLRVNLAAAQQKPGRAEMRQLQTYEAALARMREQAPGFAPAWEQALRQAQADVDAAENGLARLVRKVLPGSAPTSTSAPTEETPLIPRGEEPPAKAS